MSVSSAFFMTSPSGNIADAPDLLTAIAMFYASKGNFTQSAIQGQLDEMKGDQKKMEKINEALAYLRAANSAKDGDTFKVSAETFETLISPSPMTDDAVLAENQLRAPRTPTGGAAEYYTAEFRTPNDDENETTHTQNKIDKLKNKLDSMNNTSQMKMLSLNKYMDNLSTITSTAANAQKTVGDMNSGIAQKM